MTLKIRYIVFLTFASHVAFVDQCCLHSKWTSYGDPLDSASGVEDNDDANVDHMIHLIGKGYKFTASMLVVVCCLTPFRIINIQQRRF